jgi:hypothetical protein
VDESEACKCLLTCSNGAAIPMSVQQHTTIQIVITPSTLFISSLLTFVVSPDTTPLQTTGYTFIQAFDRNSHATND